MKLRTAAVANLPEIELLVEAALRHSVVSVEKDVQFLLAYMRRGLQSWAKTPADSLHVVCIREQRIAGVILVKNHWNLVNLFVHPQHQRSGIGRALLRHVLPICRQQSPRGKLEVYSSSVAVPFYEHLGFSHSGPAKDRPGGCVPLEYTFD